jgi:hypothetical protein
VVKVTSLAKGFYMAATLETGILKMNRIPFLTRRETGQVGWLFLEVAFWFVLLDPEASLTLLK